MFSCTQFRFFRLLYLLRFDPRVAVNLATLGSSSGHVATGFVVCPLKVLAQFWIAPQHVSEI